jgi:hypothetical protein
MTEKQLIQRAITQVDAIFRLEGFEPSDSILETDRVVLAGLGTYAESAQLLIEYVKLHKTADGFIYKNLMTKQNDRRF